MKKILTIDQQIKLLESRGMIVADKKKTKEILLDIGYYRLGFYAFPLEKTFPRLRNRTHEYKTDTTFESVVELYYFDFDLRRILLNAINRIEVNIRTRLTYYASLRYAKSPAWFVDSNAVNAKYVSNFDAAVYKSIRDNNPVIQRHHQKYVNDRYAPAWKTIEFMTLGNVEVLYESLKDSALKKQIAAEYGCSIGVFLSYLDTIRVIRNKCAHGGCTYNLNIALGIKRGPAFNGKANRHNICGAASVIKYMLSRISINRANDLQREIKNLLAQKRTKQTATIIQSCTNLSTF